MKNEITENQETPEDFNNYLENMMGNIALDKARELEIEMQELLPKLELEYKKFPAELFKKDFLRLFTGQIPEGEAKDNNAIAVWIAIAGSPHMPVDLIDENGTVVAQVPALFNSDKFIKNNSDNDRGVFVNAVTDLENMRKSHPRLAYQAYMARLLPYAEKLTTDIGINNLEGWIKLFKYFNINPDNPKEDVKQETNFDDIFEYD